MNPKRYWLRGGIIGAIISIAFDLWHMFRPSCIGLSEDGSSSCPRGFDIVIDNWNYNSVTYLIIIVISFSMGVFVGWLYGKIKHKIKQF